MSTQVQYRRGTAVQNNSFTGALAEITVDTTNLTLRVHDGITAGGSNIATVAYVDAEIGGLSADSISNGTSIVKVASSGGNIYANVGGSTILNLSSGGANITGYTTASGNVTGGNLVTAGLVSATGNITGGNLVTGAQVVATGNITGGNLNTGAQVVATGNITGGNLKTASVTIGNGPISGVTTISASGNANVGNLGAATVVATTLTGTLSTAAQTNITSVGTLSALTVTANVTGGNLVTAGQVSATGNVSGGNLNVTGNIVDTGALAIITAANGNITLSPNGTGVIVASTDIRNGQANGVGNIGSSTGYFNTVFAKATSAQYADLAEKYLADREYQPGTVLEIGGINEVTETTTFASTRIAGVVSTNPAFIMNSGETGDTVVEIALLGRVPCRVVGDIQKGDLLCSSQLPGVATSLPVDQFQPGSVIGKALENYTSDQEGVIEILVGRL